MTAPKFAISRMKFQVERLINCVSAFEKKPDIGPRQTPERYFVSRKKI